MSANTFTITIHMVASVDGFIAKKDNSVAWFETVDFYEKGIESASSESLFKTVDCYVMGARTYEHAEALAIDYGWPYGDTPIIVVTSRQLPVARPNVQLYQGDVVKLVNEQLQSTYKNVWVVGGAMLVKEFLQLQLVNYICLCMLPILLGDGLLFFDYIAREQPLHLIDTKAYKNGMVELCYEVKK